jgi:hypothetical protein
LGTYRQIFNTTQTGGAIGGSGEHFPTDRTTIATTSFSKTRCCSRLSGITLRLRLMELDLSRASRETLLL